MVEFKTVTGKSVYEKLFYEGSNRLKPESVIESRFNRAHEMATSFAVSIDKEDAPRSGRTDGLITFDLGKFQIKGIQECKKGIKSRATKAYKNNVVQNLMYAYQYENMQLALFTSETYIDWMDLDEVTTVNREEMVSVLKTGNSPSVACKSYNIDVDKLPIHKHNLLETNIDDIWKEITNHFTIKYEKNTSKQKVLV